jgi:hypothetical protein
MKSPIEWLVCLTHPKFEEAEDAIEFRSIMSNHFGVSGYVITSCRICFGFHLRAPQLSHEKLRMLFFMFFAVACCLTAVGAPLFHDPFWFAMWEVLGMLVISVAVFFQYGRLR